MPVSVNKNLAASYILEDPLGRIANDGRVSNLGRVGKKGYVDSRFAPNFDGVDEYGVLATRAINPDGDNTLEFFTPPSFSLFRSIICQNISSNGANREFTLVTGPDGLLVRIGGVETAIMTIAQGLKVSTYYGLSLIGTTAQVYEGGLGGSLVATTSFTKGAAREPTAQTIIGARGNGAGLFASFYQGLQYNIRINGVLWSMDQRNQAIQLPEPSGLGAELITPTVLENPAIKGSQWTYLGAGRWQYIGDGSFNGLGFLTPESHPSSGFLQFEIESISGTLNCTTGLSTSDVIFSTAGIKRYFYIVRGGSNENTILFKRHFVNGQTNITSCIIKNISFKPLGACNPMTLVNVTSDRWQEVAQ